MPKEGFFSEKLTQKLMRELADPLIVSSGALPSWCDELVFKYPFLFSVGTRLACFQYRMELLMRLCRSKPFRSYWPSFEKIKL